MAETDNAPVLFAYDGSDHAKNAIRQAGREFAAGRKAFVLAVWQPFAPSLLAGGGVNLPDDLAGQVEGEARQIADEGADLARQAGFDATPLVESGEPVWQRIVAVADDRDAGVIALGSHGRSGISAVLMGSVATAVAQHTDRTVLISHLASSD
jgi:nucleotide-binding universal stress UspA family protein